MPAPISVILPTLNSAASLPATCEGLMEGVYAGLIAELLVVDAGSQDETITVAKALGAEIIHWEPGGASQAAVGQRAAVGRWQLVLQPGAVLQRGWSGAVESFIENHPTRTGYFLRIGPGATWANMAAAVLGRPSKAAGRLTPAKGSTGRARAIAGFLRAA